MVVVDANLSVVLVTRDPRAQLVERQLLASHLQLKYVSRNDGA